MASIARATAFLDTDIRRFSTWAATVVRGLQGTEIAFGDGTLRLIRGVLTTATETTCRNPLMAWQVDSMGKREDAGGELFLLTGWSPSEKRTCVSVECFHPALLPVFDTVCESITEVWPEAVPQIQDTIANVRSTRATTRRPSSTQRIESKSAQEPRSVTLNKRQREARERQTIAREMDQQRITRKEIAQHLGVSNRVVYYYLKDDYLAE